MRMHAGQVDVATEVVAALVARQFPQWRDVPVSAVPSHGTVNALFRIGEAHVARFPLEPNRSTELRHNLVAEQRHARLLARHITVPVAEPVVLGEPGPGYDGPWSVWTWLDGTAADSVTEGGLEPGLADDLARLVRSVRSIPTRGVRWDGRSRGGPLAPLDAEVRDALAQCEALERSACDFSDVRQVWTCAAGAASRRRPDVALPSWLHADLMPGNLLLRQGRLAGLIDLGEVCVGDPAVDLMPAWNLLDAADRVRFHDQVDVDDDTWARGRGWAIAQAATALPCYRETNLVMARIARRTLAAVVE